MKYQSRQSVLDHLICSGFQPDYLKWVYHGEGATSASTGATLNEEIRDLLYDAFEPEGGSGGEAHDNDSNYSQEANNRGSKFDYLIKEAEEKVYPNCKHNKLSCVVHLYHLKCLNGWSDKSFTMLLQYLHVLLPEGNLLPKTTQQVKRILANLGLGYEKIHSCPNGCMLFWDEKEKDESKFTFHPVESSQIKKWILFSMGKKWRTWKGLLKSRGYDPSLTIDEIVAKQTNNDNRVNPTQFKELVARWFTPEFQNTCVKKRSSRSKMKEPHVTGTKSFARLAHELAMDNDGMYPTRGEMYIKTRTRKDGSIVDDEALGVVTSLQAIASKSTRTSGVQDDFSNDEFSKVKGPEKRGYVRLVGKMPAKKSNGDSQIIQQLESATQTISQLQGAFNVMVNIIQEHIPNANMSAILSNMNLQVSNIGSANELSSKSTDDGERADKR
ncbi:hypothetical protein SSX86_030739 [Deinandra increscens subsp. villosa]|uniref:Transposase-associated domain-containing protein n=1 Tax=Deinandra increscens subsp. villosa TaxID=3103831 RepID=A0AAP0C5C1_9ASTR